MQTPFPGMNPYLEHPALWHQVHNRLIVAYDQTIMPALSGEEAEWVKTVLSICSVCLLQAVVSSAVKCRY